MKTRWADEVGPDNALLAYPRPQMVRPMWESLNGLWQYAIIDKNATDVEYYNGEILVPYPVESSLSGVQRQITPEQKMWYRRVFRVDERWAGKRLLLHFGAVDWECEVHINGKMIGRHTGGYYPFSFEITSYLIDHENEIVVIVWDPSEKGLQEAGKQNSSAERGRGSYTPTSGIWQTVWLEPVPMQYIQRIQLTPDIDMEELTIEVQINAEGELPQGKLCVETGIDGRCERSEAFIIRTDQARDAHPFSLRIPVKNPNLWSPETPYLYDLKVRLEFANETDEISSYYGMRKFSLGADNEGCRRLLLNNKPYFHNGVLDQGFWPDGLYTAPTDEALCYDVEITKKLGFNTIRKHLKVEPARWYYHCDRLGVIVWQDMINGGKGEWPYIIRKSLMRKLLGHTIRDTTQKHYLAVGRSEADNRQNYMKELREMMDCLINVPCIGMWVPFNEGWGQFDAEKVAQFISEYDPTRTVDHASGWFDQCVGGFKSIHQYMTKLSIPKDVGDRTIIYSEYGGIAFNVQGHMWQEGTGGGQKQVKTLEALHTAYTTLIRDGLTPLIEKGASAAIYTQLTDVERETNGILTYDRAVIKVDQPDINRQISNSLSNGQTDKATSAPL